MQDVVLSVFEIGSLDGLCFEKVIERVLLSCSICILILIEISCSSSVFCREESVRISHDYVSLSISHADDPERDIAESLGSRVSDLGTLYIRAIYIVIEGQGNIVLSVIEGNHNAVFPDLKHVLCLVSPLIAVISLALTDSIGSIRQVIDQCLGCVSLLLRIPVSDDLSDILTGFDTFYRPVFEQILLGNQFLPVNSICGITDVLSYDDSWSPPPWWRWAWTSR